MCEMCVIKEIVGEFLSYVWDVWPRGTNRLATNGPLNEVA